MFLDALICLTTAESGKTDYLHLSPFLFYSLLLSVSAGLYSPSLVNVQSRRSLSISPAGIQILISAHPLAALAWDEVQKRSHRSSQCKAHSSNPNH